MSRRTTGRLLPFGENRLPKQPSSEPRRARRLGVLFTALATLGAAAENPWQKIYYGTAEVRLIDVEVIVLDADGRPVVDLSQEDFELLDSGRPVEISYFEKIVQGRSAPLSSAPPQLAVDAPAASTATVPVAAPAFPDPLQIVLFLDSPNLSAANRKRVAGQLDEFLAKSWRDDSSLTLVTRRDGLEVLGPWEAQQHRELAQSTLKSSLDEIAGRSRLDLELRDLMRELQAINVEAGSGVFELKNPGGVYAELEGVRDPNAPIDPNDTSDGAALQRARRRQQDDISREAGSLMPRIASLAQQRMEATEATLADLDQVISVTGSLAGRKALIYVSDGLPLDPAGALREAYAERIAPLRRVGDNLTSDLSAGRDELTRELRELLTRASSSGIAFYTLFAAPPSSLLAGSAELAATAGGNYGSWDDAFAASDEHVYQEGIILMAEETGGRYSLSHSAVAATLTGIYTDDDNRYVLGYVPGEVDPTRTRSIEVRLPNRRGLSLRYHHNRRDKSPAEEAAERTYAALFTGGIDNPFEASLEARAQVAAAEGNFEVPIAVSLPIDRLVLIPGTGNHQAQVSLFVAVLDDRGRRSEVRRHLCPIRVPNDQLLTALGQPATCGVRLLMRRGPQRVAVSILDELSSRHSTVTLNVDVGANEERSL